ncbi:ATP-binding cassette domain-containing protein [Streptococcus caprae]|uniref:ATP-binding cassette domain-containing protein n=1 Tax=Streptococcus caprae TaxID=1640501 RepID=A0ABV8CWQ3_9STRE
MSITSYLLRCRKQSLIVLFWIALNSLCVLGNGLASAQALTSLVSLNLSTFLFWCGVQLVVNLIWMVQINYSNPAKEKAIQEMNQLMRSDLTKRLGGPSLSDFQQQSQETYVSWLTYDLETINDMGFEVLEYMLSQAFNILLGVGTLIVYHPSFLVSICLFAGLMTLIPKLFSQALAEKAVDFTQKNEALIHQISNRLSGFRILLGANKLDHIEQTILHSGDQYASSKISYAKTFGQMMALQNGTSFISQIAMIVQAGILFSLHLVPIGSVSSAPYFASIIFASLTGFFANYAELKNCQAIFDKWQSLENSRKSSGQPATFQQQVELKQTSLIFPDQATLSLPDLVATPGQKLALVGPSGSGKSSLLSLLLKERVPETGQVTWDTADSQQLSEDSLHDLIALVPQSPYLFDDSLRYNLTLGHAISDNRICNILDQLGLTDWRAQLPKGLDSFITQKELSGGQAQRLCLARALLADKPILLLDEATSAVEPSLRQTIENQLLSLDKTIFMVTHHLTPETEKRCDTVVRFSV